MYVFFHHSCDILGLALEAISLCKFIGQVALLGILEGGRGILSNNGWKLGKLRNSCLSSPLGCFGKGCPRSGLWHLAMINNEGETNQGRHDIEIPL